MDKFFPAFFDSFTVLAAAEPVLYILSLMAFCVLFKGMHTLLHN
jgi:hypothetical protein